MQIKRESKAVEAFRMRASEVALGVVELLVEKNIAYGNSALAPSRIFSRADSVEQLLVRIDDKLSRIRTVGFNSDTDEDTVSDLIGYLILLKLATEPTGTEVTI